VFRRGPPVTSDGVTTTAKRQRQREGRVARMEAERRAAQKAARKRRVITLLVVVVVVLGLMALISVLGGDDGGGEEDAAPSTTTTTAPEKPEVTIPETPPPTELQTSDLVVGEGAEATAGSAVEVHYVGRAFSTGEEFDSSYDREALAFTIGDPNILEGWHQGIAGMREGGRRQLIIPPALAYGEAGRPPEIGPNDTLIFVIDLLKVEEPPEPLPPPAPAPPQPGG
jgi:peptidylprolyl isomerase